MSAVPSKYFLDTNTLIDLATNEREFHKEAVDMVLLGAKRGDEFLAGVSSLKDMYYIMRRQYVNNEREVRTVVKMVRESFTMVDLTSGIADRALSSDEVDFEDGIIRAYAEMTGCDAIISRDAKAFKSSPLPKIEPKDFR